MEEIVQLITQVQKQVNDLRSAIADFKKRIDKPRPSIDFITLAAAAEMLNVSKTQILRLHKAGKLHVHAISARKFYVRKSELEAYMDMQLLPKGTIDDVQDVF